MNLGLENKRGLFTGSTGGIGEGIAMNKSLLQAIVIMIVGVLIGAKFSGNPLGWLGSLLLVAGYWSGLFGHRHRRRLHDRQPQWLPHADLHAQPAVAIPK
jgi:hypothetical protein